MNNINWDEIQQREEKLRYDSYIGALSALHNLTTLDLYNLKEYFKYHHDVIDFVNVIIEAIHDKEVMEQ